MGYLFLFFFFNVPFVGTLYKLHILYTYTLVSYLLLQRNHTKIRFHKMAIVNCYLWVRNFWAAQLAALAGVSHVAAVSLGLDSSQWLLHLESGAWAWKLKQLGLLRQFFSLFVVWPCSLSSLSFGDMVDVCRMVQDSKTTQEREPGRSLSWARLRSQKQHFCHFYW